MIFFLSILVRPSFLFLTHISILSDGVLTFYYAILLLLILLRHFLG
jgi:hypothetical protein